MCLLNMDRCAANSQCPDNLRDKRVRPYPALSPTENAEEPYFVYPFGYSLRLAADLSVGRSHLSDARGNRGVSYNGQYITTGRPNGFNF